MARFLLPALSIANVFLYSSGIIQASLFYSLLSFFFLISLLISRQVHPHYVHLNKIAGEIDTLAVSMGQLESLSFKAPLLARLQEEITHENEKASGIIKQLKKIIDRLDYRLNPLIFLPLNTVLFWDLQQVFSLENWKKRYGHKTEHWFAQLAEAEALSSLGTLYFNHPAWIFPNLTEEPGCFQARQLGHPLIPEEKRIDSSFSTSGRPQIGLITGSNMAGKSTFLRSVGVNLVLAMSGAPVCARQLTVSPMKVISSMRVSDNLEESTSTFYAELKKLKYVLDAVNRKEAVFLLLDEILRGTNSADRHAGSSALIRQLMQHEAAGLIATHDLELAKLAGEFPSALRNYHFDVQVSGEELYFDYKLKEGICRSMNASLLMRKIGIEL